MIGLAVMGENLALNMEAQGFTVSVCNRTTSKADAFTAGRGHGKNIIGTHCPERLIKTLPRPRKIMLMVRSGRAVDALIDQLVPRLDEKTAGLFRLMQPHGRRTNSG